jgi:hypothetical protein
MAARPARNSPSTAGGPALAFAADFDQADAPTTCEDVLTREAEEDPTWRNDLRGATFSIESIGDEQATVTLQGSGQDPPSIGLRLVKSDGRWLVDDSDAVPEGD